VVFKRDNLSKSSQASISTTLLWLAALQLTVAQRLQAKYPLMFRYQLELVLLHRFKLQLSKN